MFEGWILEQSLKPVWYHHLKESQKLFLVQCSAEIKDLLTTWLINTFVKVLIHHATRHQSPVCHHSPVKVIVLSIRCGMTKHPKKPWAWNGRHYWWKSITWGLCLINQCCQKHGVCSKQFQLIEAWINMTGWWCFMIYSHWDWLRSNVVFSCFWLTVSLRGSELLFSERHSQFFFKIIC